MGITEQNHRLELILVFFFVLHIFRDGYAKFFGDPGLKGFQLFKVSENTSKQVVPGPGLGFSEKRR
jgi:hypothetical protein